MLDDALHRFAHADKPTTGDTGAIVRNLFTGTRDTATWRARITMLVQLYNKHHVLSALGQGLVQSISLSTAPMVSDAAVRTWRDVWQEHTGDRSEFQIPLRLLDVAVRYRESRDLRVLLELPVEERKLLEPLLKVKEAQKRETKPSLPRSTRRRKSESRRGRRKKQPGVLTIEATNRALR